MRPRNLVMLSVVSLLVACERDPDLPLSYETEHLSIHTDAEQRLCAGDLIAFEATIHRVEVDLGFSMEENVSVWIWSDEAWPDVYKKYCGPGVLGCTVNTKSSIYTSLSIIDHELVHAAVPDESLTPFFAEGLADVYGGRQTRFGQTAPADNLGLSEFDLDQWTARHFVRWLRETWGTAKLGELVRLGKHADDRFEEVYGLSFAEAEAKYFAEAPWGYPSLDSCNGEPLDVADDLGGWREMFAFDCDAGEDVRAYPAALVVESTFIIPTAGHYSVSTDADAFSIGRCATGPIEAPLRLVDFLGEDVPPIYAGELSEEYRFYEGGPTLDLYFEAGKHEIQLGLLGFDGGEVNLAIWPTMGPQPVGKD